MKRYFQILVPAIFIVLAVSCNNEVKTDSSIELIQRNSQQDSLFRDLVAVTQNAIPETDLGDSLAFLVLPVEASCPSCRSKTIDSIVKYQDKLTPNHFIIVSANGGRKTISGYFRSENSELPVIENRLFLDSNNLASQYKLYDKKPTMYYTYQKKAYKRVAAVPMTIKQDLQEFFSGYRSDNNK